MRGTQYRRVFLDQTLEKCLAEHELLGTLLRPGLRTRHRSDHPPDGPAGGVGVPVAREQTLIPLSLPASAMVLVPVTRIR